MLTVVKITKSYNILIIILVIIIISPLTLSSQSDHSSFASGSLQLSSWAYAAFSVVILFLLYIIRKYEKSRQGIKLMEEKSRSSKAESDFQKTRQDYLEILDSLQDGYVETDRNGIIRHANLPFVEELGFHIREDVIGKYFLDFIQKKYASDVTNKFRILFETGQSQERFETRFSGKDGKHFIGEAVVSPVFDTGQDLSGQRLQSGIIR